MNKLTTYGAFALTAYAIVAFWYWFWIDRTSVQSKAIIGEYEHAQDQIEATWKHAHLESRAESWKSDPEYVQFGRDAAEHRPAIRRAPATELVGTGLVLAVLYSLGVVISERRASRSERHDLNP